MPPVSVNIAVLSNADLAAREVVAMETAVADRLTEAGHKIVAFSTVKNSEVAIRSELVGWIADPEIDVVIVVGEGDAVGKSLKPMIDQSLPGFADLLRKLASEAIGKGALLSVAEAARCGTTFVFVLPGNEKAVAAAMDKVVLPQLDPRTKPRNLIAAMPRLRDAVTHDVTRVDVTKIESSRPSDPSLVTTAVNNARLESARVESAKSDAEKTRVGIDVKKIEESRLDSVPTPVAFEKTETGAGPAARLPAMPSGRADVAKPDSGAPSRPRSRTGANVIVRRVEDTTKPIDLERLEREIAASKDEDATKSAPPTPSIEHTRPTLKPLPSIVSKSGPAPVPDTVDDDHTKPMDLSQPTRGPAKKLAEQTQTNVTKPTEVTKPMDLSRLPKLPPGADKDVLDDDAIAPPPIARPTPVPVAAPEPQAELGRIQLKQVASRATPPIVEIQAPQADEPIELESTSTPITPDAPAQRATPTPLRTGAASNTGASNTGAPNTRASNTGASNASASNTGRSNTEASNIGASNTEASNTAASSTAFAAALNDAASSTAATRGKPTSAASGSARAKPTPPPRAATPPAGARATAPATGVAREPLTTPPARPPARTRPPTPPPPPPNSFATAAAREALDAPELDADLVQELPATSSPSLAALTPASPWDKIAAAPSTSTSTSTTAAATSPAAVASAAESVSTSSPLAASDLPEPRSSASDLPRGSFVYPTAKPKSRVPLVAGLLVLSAGIGGGAMYFLKRDSGQEQPPKVEKVEKVVEFDAAPVPVAQIEIDAAEPAPVIEVDAAVEEPTPPDAAVAETPTKPPKKGRETKPPRTNGKTNVIAEATPPKHDPPKQDPPKQDDGECGEVQCVLDKYARPCCLKFKPAGGTFTPPVAADPDKLQKTQIKAGVDRMKPRVIACGEQFKGVKGTVKVSMSVDPEGNVSDVSVSTSPDDGLGSCVADVMKKAKFAKTPGGGSFTYPFVF